MLHSYKNLLYHIRCCVIRQGWHQFYQALHRKQQVYFQIWSCNAKDICSWILQTCHTALATTVNVFDFPILQLGVWGRSCSTKGCDGHVDTNASLNDGNSFATAGATFKHEPAL